MEFWGVEVKPGESLKCDPEENKYLHLSQASLGESKGKENVPLSVKINDQKLVIGTLSADKCTQISLDLVFEKEFELSHTSKNTSVHFCGYKSAMQDDQSDDEFPESESEPEEVPLGQNANGKPLAKEGKPNAGKAVKEDNQAAKKVKKAEPTKAEKPKTVPEDDEDDDEEEDSEEDSDADEDLAEAMGDSDEEDEDDSSEDEDEATPPKKSAPGKRPSDSASKTPPPEKKAKVVTPAGGQKTGGGKKEVHVATPHPAKKTAGNSDKSKQQTPKSAGSVSCKSCSRTFNSENALQAHTKAKHA